MAELDQLDPPAASKAGIQAALDKVRTNLVITPVGTSTRARTSPSRRKHAVNPHSPAVLLLVEDTSSPEARCCWTW